MLRRSELSDEVGILLNEETRQRLTTLAYARLEATANDDEQHSFLFRTPGARSFLAFLREDLDTFDPYLVDIDDLDLPWSDERWSALQNLAQPTAGEAEEWRTAVAHFWISEAQQPGCDWRYVLWLTPLIENETVVAIAIFASLLEGAGDPYLLGLYDDEQAAENALNRLCVARG